MESSMIMDIEDYMAGKRQNKLPKEKVLIQIKKTY